MCDLISKLNLEFIAKRRKGVRNVRLLRKTTNNASIRSTWFISEREGIEEILTDLIKICNSIPKLEEYIKTSDVLQKLPLHKRGIEEKLKYAYSVYVS